MYTFIIQLLGFCKNLLSPPFCLYCRKNLSRRVIFCDDCLQQIKPTVPYKLQITATRHVWVHAVSLYDDPLKLLILQKRQKNIIGSYALADFIWERTVFKQLPCDFIVPIPLHWFRYIMRGFNQAEEIGITLAGKHGVACKSLLKRVRYTSYQSSLPVAERERNVKNVFRLKMVDEKYKDKDFIIIDDLMTTGSTIKYAVKELLKLKPRSISVVVGCRARL